MESWSRVIVDWINCLGLVDTPINSLHDLQHDSVFYLKLIGQLKVASDHKSVFTFIQDEYPEFSISDESSISSQVYLASLMLLHTSQNESFHKPMYSLKTETQVQIKKFLELMLPYEKSVSMDILSSTILELGDSTSSTPPSTPKDRPLRSFLTSPAAQSAYRHRMINDRNRELLQLKATLETERFEKADLLEDIRVQEGKILNLQKKLKERSTELKILRAEKTQIATPQSTKKTNRHDNLEQILKKEIQDLELYNSKLRSEIDEFRDKNEELTRRLTSKERLNSTLKQNADEYERGMQALSLQIEAKTNELLDLRMQNEELRAHIKGMSRNLDPEQSFEVENISRARSPLPNMNVSEVASSIIEIQLREANDECSLLKTEMSKLETKLQEAYEQCTEKQNEIELLNNKVVILDEIRMSLEITEDKLSKRDCQINILEMEKQTFVAELEKLREDITAKEKSMKNIEEQRLKLEQQIANINNELNNLKIALVTAEDSLEQSEATNEVLVMRLKTHESKMKSLEENIQSHAAKHLELQEESEKSMKRLRESLDTATLGQKQLQETLRLKAIDLEHISRDCDDKNVIIQSLKTKNSQFETELNNKCSVLINVETKLCELNELKEELQSQLVQERSKALALNEQNQQLQLKLSSLEATKTQLDDELGQLRCDLTQSQVQTAMLDEKYKFEEGNHEKSKEKIRILLSDVDKMSLEITNANTEICQLKDIQENLQNRLTQEQETCMELVTEKAELEHTISKTENEKIDLIKRVTALQNELDECRQEIEQTQANYNNLTLDYRETSEKLRLCDDELAKVKSELNDKVRECTHLKDSCRELIGDLDQAQGNIQTLSGEKAALEIAVLVRDDDKKKLNDKIENLEVNLSKSNTELEKITVELENSTKNLNESIKKIEILTKEITEKDEKLGKISTARDKLQNELNNVSKELQIQVEKCKKIQSELDKVTLINSKITISTSEQEKALMEHIQNLENKLLLSENESENLKLEAKLQEEALNTLKLKLKEFNNEKMDSELKLKEVIKGLQEVRSSQEGVLEAQAKAIADKTAELDSLEKQHGQIKAAMEKQIEMFKAQNKELTDYCDELKIANGVNSRKIEELQDLIDKEEERLEISEEKYGKLEAEYQNAEKEHMKIKESLERQISSLKSENENLKNNYETYKVSSEKHSNKIDELQGILDVKQRDLQNVQEKYTKVEEELQNCIKEHLEVEKCLQAEIELQKIRIDDLKHQYETLTISDVNSRQNIAELQEILDIKQQELLHSEENYTKLKEELENFKHEQSEHQKCLEDEILLEKIQINELKTNMETLQAANENNSKELDELQVILEEKRQKLLTAQENYAKIEEELGDFKKEHLELEKCLRDEISLQKSQIDDLKKNLEAQKQSNDTVSVIKEENSSLSEKLKSLEMESNKRNEYLTSLIAKKSDLQTLLTQALKMRDDQDQQFSDVRQSFNAVSLEVQNNIKTNSSACDELKHLEARRIEIEGLLNDFENRHSKNSKPLMKTFSRLLLWVDNHLQQAITVPFIKSEPNETNAIDLVEERTILEAEIQRNERNTKDLLSISIKIDELRSSCNSYETNVKSGIVKREPSVEEKLQIQLDRLAKERKDLKDKLDAARLRNVKMEKNMEDLRNELKKIKSENSETIHDNKEIERLNIIIDQLQRDVERLQKEKSELEETKSKDQDIDEKLKEIHHEYGLKLEKIKQKMKVAYNEQIEKINQDQERLKTEKVAAIQAKMEQQCKKYTEDIAKYKAHISDLSSQFWDVGEKLLAEKQEKQMALQRLNEIQMKHAIAMSEVNNQNSSTISAGVNQMNCGSLDRDYKRERGDTTNRASFRTVQVIEEQHTTTTRRHSVKSIQAMGNAFNVEDEEGEVFDNVYLADLKEGRFRTAIAEPPPDFDRMSELRMRNSLCRPHLKSSYAVETHFHPSGLTEEDIKSGPTADDTFNDSLSQSLLPGQKAKKKDRTQTSYKKPGPPTPSKNGGRLSLQGNELKSPASRILRERNSERRTTATPKRLKDFFGTSLSRRQDENAPATPKGRRLSNIFRKPRPAEKS